MQLCRIIYYSLVDLRVSSDIFAHSQEHLNCITVSGITHLCRCRLVSWECWRRQETVRYAGRFGETCGNVSNQRYGQCIRPQCRYWLLLQGVKTVTRQAMYV